MRRNNSQSLDYGRLESRQLLASFAFYPDNIQLKSFAEDQVLSIFESGESVVFYLPEADLWYGTDLPGTIEGHGTSVLTMNRSLLIGKSLHVSDATETMDVVFASDLEFDIVLLADSVNQAAGTTLVLGGEILANAVTLREVDNQLDLSLYSTFVDLNSGNPIEIRDLVASFGGIRSASELSVGTYNPSFSRLQVNVTMTLEAPNLEIRSSRLGVTGRLNLIGRDSVSLISNNINPGDGTGFGPFVGYSELNQLNFQSHGEVVIRMTEYPGEFAYPKIGQVFLVGDNRARNLSIDVAFESVFDVEQSTLQVAEHAFISATGKIFLADHAANLIHIGGRAHFEANSYFPEIAPGIPAQEGVFGSLYIAKPGDVRFGWLRSNDSTYITVHEDDVSYLARIGDADREGKKGATQLVDIQAGLGITIAPTGGIVSDSVIRLGTSGRIESAIGTEQVIRAKRLELTGNVNLDQLEVAQVNFHSTGDVQLQSNRQLVLTGNNQAKDIFLTVHGLLANTSGTVVEAESLSVAAESIWLANASPADQVTISVQAVFSAANGFATVRRLGQVDVGLLNFNAYHTEMNLAGNLYLFGNNIAQRAILRSNDSIADAPGTQMRIAGDAVFATPRGVYLADRSSDFVSICGHTLFDVREFAFVNSTGTVEMNTWQVLNDAFELVVRDSEC